MTTPRVGDATEKSEQPEGTSAAVRVKTDVATEQDTEEADTIDTVDGEVSEPEDIENELGAAPSGEAEAAVPDDQDVDRNSPPSVPAKGKLRFRWPWTRSDIEDGARQAHEQSRVRGGVAAPSRDAEDRSEQRNDESVERESEALSDAADRTALGESAKGKRRISWSPVLAYGVLPASALLLAVAGGFLKWQDSSDRAMQIARIESVAAAKDSTIALLSYKSESVEKDLDAAKSRLTGTFKDSFSQLINDVVIPGAKRAHVSTTATVPSAASVSATPSHAVTLLFVNQTAAIDKDPPADSLSSVRVTLDKVGGRWLISGFDPV
jgi:Mce-associated membrane protein